MSINSFGVKLEICIWQGQAVTRKLALYKFPACTLFSWVTEIKPTIGLLFHNYAGTIFTLNKNWPSPPRAYRHHFIWGLAEEEVRAVLASGPERWIKQPSKMHSNGFVVEWASGQIPPLPVHCPLLLPFSSRLTSALPTFSGHLQSPSTALKLTCVTKHPHLRWQQQARRNHPAIPSSGAS